MKIQVEAKDKEIEEVKMHSTSREIEFQKFELQIQELSEAKIELKSQVEEKQREVEEVKNFTSNKEIEFKKIEVQLKELATEKSSLQVESKF